MKSRKILQEVGHELKVNPPKVLKRTRSKFGSERAGRQRTAILFDKARRRGARIPNPRRKTSRRMY